MWSFDGTSWTFVSGSSTADQLTTNASRGGIAGVAVSYISRARFIPQVWNSFDIFFFGGIGITEMKTQVYLSDLWSISLTEMTLYKAAAKPNTRGVYGSFASSHASNIPGSRAHMMFWFEPVTSSLFLFGGFGYDEYGKIGLLNDMWVFCNYTWHTSPSFATGTSPYSGTTVIFTDTTNPHYSTSGIAN